MDQIALKVPIFTRITVNGKRTELSTGKSALLKSWVSKTGRVKGNGEEARMINRYLDNINVRLNRIFDKMEDAEETITAQEIKSRFLGKNSNTHSVIELFETHNHQIKCQIGNGYSAGTLERYETSLKHLKGYLNTHKKDDYKFEDLNYSFIADF
ncbi:MAG: phage integrase SAM-like domain-containing protein [Cyclobacteriaceae bacterium]|nr:phage integrase SAM-like domain-containing protein [Cyclobacteriaceae bacterium]